MQSIPLGFAILAHDDPAHLARLCRKLLPHPVLIHVDAKSGALDLFQELLPGNARIISHRSSVHWADFGMVEATLALIDEWRACSLPDHLVLLSGHCYPIRPVADLLDFLRSQGGIDAIQSVPISNGSHLSKLVGRRWRQRPFLPDTVLQSSQALATIEKLARRLWNKAAKLWGRDFAREIAPAALRYGSQWWALRRETVLAVNGYLSTNSHFLRSFRTAYAPDELVFATATHAAADMSRRFGGESDLGEDTLYDAPLHLVVQSPDRWAVDSAALREQIAVSGKFFIRKVHTRRADLCDWIDRTLL